MLGILRGKPEIDFGNRSKSGVVEKEIHPKFGGRIWYQGTSWKAKEINGKKVSKGEEVTVIKRVGMEQWIEYSA